jgi:hypothetical protein
MWSDATIIAIGVLVIVSFALFAHWVIENGEWDE